MPPWSLDFETYSEAGHLWDVAARKWRGPPNAPQGKKGLPVVGAAVYAQHPSTEVLTLSYGLPHAMRRWRPGQLPPFDLFDHVGRGGLLQGWNTAFEWWIWNYVCHRRYGWPRLPLEQLRCTMARARAHAMPGKLRDAAQVMRLHHLKLDDGKRLLDKFSKPRNPTKGDPRTRIRPEDDPADAILLYRYCDVDVLAENEAAAQLPPLDGQELAYWLADQRINRRGVAIDVQSVEACAAIVGQAHERYNAELRALTGGAVEKASQVQELATWLRTLGVPVGFGAGSMDEDALEAMLKLPGLPPLARRALEIRAAIGSAAVKKLYAMQRQCAGGRLHDLFNFHAAHTGRPTGDGPQPTNLPNSGPRVYRCDCGRHFGQHLRACPWCGVPA